MAGFSCACADRHANKTATIRKQDSFPPARFRALEDFWEAVEEISLVGRMELTMAAVKHPPPRIAAPSTAIRRRRALPASSINVTSLSSTVIIWLASVARTPCQNCASSSTHGPLIRPSIKSKLSEPFRSIVAFIIIPCPHALDYEQIRCLADDK